MNRSINLLQLVSASKDLAARAGMLIKNVFESGNLQIIEKANISNKNISSKIKSSTSIVNAKNVIDPQTIADIAAQQLIISSLMATFPGITVIGEEDEQQECLIAAIKPLLNFPAFYYNKQNACSKWFHNQSYERVMNQNFPASDICVWVDPIDGTKEYTEGITDAVTCLIGIAYKGRPIAGVVGRPFNSQTAFSFAGIPCAFLEYRDIIKNNNNNNTEVNEHKGHKQENSFDENILNVGGIIDVKILTAKDFETRDHKRRVIVCSRSHMDDITYAHIEKCKPSTILRRGGCGGKILMILEGDADAYVYCSSGTKKWDTCACECLLECVGGCMTQANGDLFDYNKDVVHVNSHGVIGSWKKGDYHDSFCMPKESK